jgi:V/A-type H+-transporting ATPase subunit K
METFWTVVAAGGTIAVTALATALAQSKIGSATAAALAEKPELRTTAVLMIAIPETMVVLGFVIAVLILLRGG